MQKDTKRLIFLFVLVIGLLFHFTSLTARAEPVQWVSNGHWYDVVDAPAINWLEANAVANAKQFNGLKGHLVTITTEAEKQFLVDSFGVNLGNRWIGGFQSEGATEPNDGWTWVTGEFWQYTYWAIGEPNNAGGNENALILVGGELSLWNDLDASNNAYWIPGYVIEYEPTLLERVEELESQFKDLQKDLQQHSHTYLTGEGTGHNNTKAETGPPTFPSSP
jgi:hypothetical protein